MHTGDTNLLSILAKLLHEEVQQSTDNLFVFLGQCKSDGVRVDMEWTDHYRLR